MDNRWQEIERIYHAARELEKCERAAFLAEACAGDEDLRREVESLLAEDADLGSFLQSPAIEVAAESLAKGKQLSDPSKPALEIGTMIAHYRLAEKIGEGGMGEVYRARDTRLQRDVALKILPQVMSRDPERMARFEREAQVLASLNHPNIAAIHGLEESNGIRALAMELVDGETLAEKIVGEGSALPRERGALPYEDALPIAQQIAEALEYAHERGVIHRDLKPANVKITPEGTVKVLDFGLAKLLGPQGSSAAVDLANSPTLTTLSTQPGMLLGTAAYMSPEQAKGQHVDRRCDIWAFGCVLFEMLTGRKAFDGETISDVLAAVIKGEPDWTAIPETTPLSIQKLIRRCLQKDVRQRLQAIGEARIAIEETLSSSPLLASPLPPGEGGPGERDRVRVSPLRRALPWGVAATFLVLAVFFAIVYFRATSAPVRATRSFISPPEDASFAFDQALGAPALSPDGTRLVFPARDASGKEVLWVRPLDSLTAKPLEGSEGAEFAFWAPDSRQLGYFQQGKLKKVDLKGGPPVILGDAPSGRGGAWSRNNVIVYVPQVLGGLSSVPVAGGASTSIASPKGSGGLFSNRWPVFLPDGRHFLYLSGDLTSPGTSKLGIFIGELGSDEQKRLLQADSNALYTPPGYLLFLRGDTLMAQPFDAGDLTLKGEAFPVAEHVGSLQLHRLGLFSVSQTGLLVYATKAGGNGGKLFWMDANGKEIGKVGQQRVLGLRLSPDGARLAYWEENSETKNFDIWLIDLNRGVQSRFTFDIDGNLGPVWSPDGSRIAYASWGSGLNNMNIFMKNASGAGNPEALLESGVPKLPTDWSHDGRYILFDAFDPKTGLDIWVLPLFGDRKPFPHLQTKFNERSAVFSPDGHWVAYQSDESGDFEVFLSPFPPGVAKWKVSQGGGQQPEWKRDSSAVYYIAPGGKLMEASVKEKSSGVEIGPSHELFQGPVADSRPGGFTYSVAPDGKRFLVVKAEQGASPPLTLVTTWTVMLNK